MAATNSDKELSEALRSVEATAAAASAASESAAAVAASASSSPSSASQSPATLPAKVKIRIGIDVGGTFTHAIALNAQTCQLIGQAKVPTTHKAAEGVALGIVEALHRLLAECSISPESVTFIAHSTTQATNALLEGDVAKVGILAMGAGTNNFLVKKITNLKAVEVSPGRFIETYHQFVDTTNGVNREVIEDALENLKAKGAEAIAISEGFAVDNPASESFALEIARAKSFLATSGSEVSQLYGLKVRTRTAVINASMLPKMIESANMTETSVRKAGILAPIMIMRSDGGVMDIEAMRKKPILTMLSGPAAGVAAATMFLRVSDGIFVEVGGTSTDISTIKDGRALVRSGDIGGNKVYMRTLDVRTLGVAGGSLYRVKGTHFVDVGPRSAHIAGLRYASFTDIPAAVVLKSVRPLKNDPEDYVALSDDDSSPASYCLTPTCAANFLGLVPEDNCARGNMDSINTALTKLADRLGIDAKSTAESMQSLAAEKCVSTIKAMLKEYKLDPELVVLIGGGGGAAAIVPSLAKKMNMRFEIADHADVISAIGVAMALIRETVERQVINPTKEDILALRAEAASAVQKMGADPKTVEIQLEIDNRTNTLRATAYGAAAGVTDSSKTTSLSRERKLELAAASMRVSVDMIKLYGQTDFFEVYAAEVMHQRLLGLLSERQNAFRVLDITGSIRLQSQNGVAVQTTGAGAPAELERLIEDYSTWGDAGKVIPGILLLIGARIVDLSGLLGEEQVLAVARTELENVPAEQQIIVLVRLSHS